MLSASGGNPVMFRNTTIGSVPIELLRDQVPATVDNFLKYVNDGKYNDTIFHRYIPGFAFQGGGYHTTSPTFTDTTQFDPILTNPPIQNEFDNWAKLTGSGASLTSGNAVISLGTNVDLSHVAVGDRVRLNGRTDGMGGSNMFDIVAVSDSNDTVTVAFPPFGPPANNLNWAIFPKVNVPGTLAMATGGGDPNSATSQFFLNLPSGSGDNSSYLDIQNGGYTVFARLLDLSSIDLLSGLTTTNQGGDFSHLPLADNNQLVVLNSVTSGDELIAGNDIFNIDEDSQGTLLDVLANDQSSSGGPISIVAVGASSAGAAVAITANGTHLIYTPRANFFGKDTFQYTITNGGHTTVATVVMQVLAVNDPPIAVNDSFAVDTNSKDNRLEVLSNDSIGPDQNEMLSITSVIIGSQGGTIVISPDRMNLRYSPKSGFVGRETFTYSIKDDGGLTSQANVTVNVVRPIVTVNYVDSNNNQVFDAGIDVPLTHGELDDGSFSTTKREGGYKTIVRGAGLVINVGIKGAKDLDYQAEGKLVVNASLTAGRDIQLRGAAVVILGALNAGRDVILQTDGPITAVGTVIKAERDVSVLAGKKVPAPIVLDATVVRAGRDVEVSAQRGRVSMVGANVTAGRNTTITARDELFADLAQVLAKKEIDVIASRILGSPHWNAPKISIKTKKP